MILARPLLTDSLALQELARADEVMRAKLTIGWQLSGLAQMEGMLWAGETRGDDVGEAKAAVAQTRRAVNSYARRQGFEPPKHWQPDDHAKALAEKHGRGEEHLNLLMLHLFVHGAAFAAEQLYSTAEDDLVLIGQPGADDGWAESTAVGTTPSALYAARAICVILDRPEPPEIAELLSAVEALSSDEKLP